MDIKEVRKGLGLTQYELATKCGVSLNTIRNWEYGVTTPNEDNMKKLKKVLKVEV